MTSDPCLKRMSVWRRGGEGAEWIREPEGTELGSGGEGRAGAAAWGSARFEKRLMPRNPWKLHRARPLAQRGSCWL